MYGLVKQAFADTELFFSAVNSEEFREEERCEQQFFVMSLEITDF